MWTSIATLIVLSMMTTIGFAPGATRVEAAPRSVTGILPGDKFTISLNIYNGVGVSSWEVRLRWDPFAMKMVGIAEGTYLSNVGPTFFIYSLSKLGDTVLVGDMLLGFEPANGDGTLFTITFQCVGSQSTKIAVEPKLYDVYVNRLPCNSKDAQVTPSSIVEVTGRWEEHQHFDVTYEVFVLGEDRFVALSALLSNSGPIDNVRAYAEFFGFDLGGNVIRLTSPIVIIPLGGQVVTSALFDTHAYRSGTFEFTARAWFNYTVPTVWYRAEKVKSLSFVTHSMHDVDVTIATDKATLNRTKNEYIAKVTMTAMNRGDFTETFDITLDVGGTVLQTFPVTLLPGKSTTINYNWDTTGLAPATYTLTAKAPVQYDVYTDDNTAQTKVKIILI